MITVIALNESPRPTFLGQVSTYGEMSDLLRSASAADADVQFVVCNGPHVAGASRYIEDPSVFIHECSYCGAMNAECLDGLAILAPRTFERSLIRFVRTREELLQWQSDGDLPDVDGYALWISCHVAAVDVAEGRVYVRPCKCGSPDRCPLTSFMAPSTETPTTVAPLSMWEILCEADEGL